MLSGLDRLQTVVPKLVKEYRESTPMNALDYDVFLNNFLAYESSKNSITYPYTVNIPRSRDEMLNGDFSPSRQIVVEGPISYEGNEIWTGSSSKGIELHFGYENGDKRYYSQFMLDGKTKAHGVMAGSTGAGKSVALNVLLFNILFNYAPWEVEVLLSDPKISEFKRYGTEHHIPHISTIAATGDTGYLLSVLTRFEDDMQKDNAVLAKAGVTSVTDFREVTKLNLPRKVLVLDETTAMFESDPKKTKEIEKLISSVARLGRSVGYHLILASQSIDSTMSGMIHNIPVRMCLKCNEAKTSTMILGNDQGALGDVGNGKMYVNQEATRGDKKDNKKFRVPLQSKDQFSKQGIFLDKCGERLGFRRKVNFYDEEAKLFEEKLISLCRTRENLSSLVIGEPSFVCDTPEKLELIFKYKDNENVLVFAQSMDDCHRYFKTMYVNALEDRVKGIRHKFLVGDDEFLKEIDPKEDGFVRFNIKETESPIWVSTVRSIYSLILIQEVDALVFRRLLTNEESDKRFDDLITGIARSNTNRSRMLYANELLETPKNMKNFKLDQISNKETLRKTKDEILVYLFDIIKSLGSEYVTKAITIECLPIQYYHLVGLQKIYGMGRGARSTALEVIKKLFQDAYSARCVFIGYTNNMEDFSDCSSGFRYFILDKVSKFSGKVRCSEYPEQVRPVCAVLYDNLMTSEVRTFKRISLSVSD